MDLMHELDSMQTDIDEHIKRNGREAGPGDAEAAGGGVPGPLGAARARSGLGWSRGPAAAAAAAEEGPAEPGAQLPRDGGAPKAGRPAGGRRAGGTAAPRARRPRVGAEGMSVYSEEDYRRAFPNRGGGAEQ
jgi:hypothetical protein